MQEYCQNTLQSARIYLENQETYYEEQLGKKWCFWINKLGLMYLFRNKALAEAALNGCALISIDENKDYIDNILAIEQVMMAHQEENGSAIHEFSNAQLRRCVVFYLTAVSCGISGPIGMFYGLSLLVPYLPTEHGLGVLYAVVGLMLLAGTFAVSAMPFMTLGALAHKKDISFKQYKPQQLEFRYTPRPSSSIGEASYCDNEATECSIAVNQSTFFQHFRTIDLANQRMVASQQVTTQEYQVVQ